MIARWSLAALSWLVLVAIFIVSAQAIRINAEVAAMLERDGLMESGQR